MFKCEICYKEFSGKPNKVEVLEDEGPVSCCNECSKELCFYDEWEKDAVAEDKSPGRKHG